MLNDFDRPLSGRGKRDAPRVGKLLLDLDLLPDVILTSPAVRALATSEQLAEACGYQGEIISRRDFYLAGPPVYLAALGSLDEKYGKVMLVGHNPGLEELVFTLTGVEEHLPTAALAQVNLPVNSWQDFSPQTQGELVHCWKPKESG